MTPGESVEHGTGPSVRLLVVYTTRLEECRAFYASLGLSLVAERHGTGPTHYAAALPDGCVFELYPAKSAEGATGRIRIALDAGAHPASAPLPNAPLPNDRGLYIDPDGRTVDVVNWGNNPGDG